MAGAGFDLRGVYRPHEVGVAPLRRTHLNGELLQRRGATYTGSYRFNAATPGSSIPARNSSDAPPPVETWVILLVTPAALMAFSESPPPTTEMAPEAATALASATVPASKGGFSKMPMGPFQITVFAPAITLE